MHLDTHRGVDWKKRLRDYELCFPPSGIYFPFLLFTFFFFFLWNVFSIYMWKIYYFTFPFTRFKEEVARLQNMFSLAHIMCKSITLHFGYPALRILLRPCCAHFVFATLSYFHAFCSSQIVREAFDFQTVRHSRGNPIHFVRLLFSWEGSLDTWVPCESNWYVHFLFTNICIRKFCLRRSLS